MGWSGGRVGTYITRSIKATENIYINKWKNIEKHISRLNFGLILHMGLCQNGAKTVPFFPSEPIPCGLPGPGPQRKSAETSGTQGSSDQVIRVSYV